MSRASAFSVEVHRLRDKYASMRDATRLAPSAGQRVVDQAEEKISNIVHYIRWCEQSDGHRQCIRLADIPGTLSGNILRLRANLPLRDDDFEIIGDDVHPFLNPPNPPEPYEDDSEDLTTVLGWLPLVNVDPDMHFVKKGKYESEVQNLLKCQGDACPGTPLSPYVISLLGKSRNRELVFPKFSPWYRFVPFTDLLVDYKRWILHLINGLESLHSRGIVHRDLRLDNLLFSSDGERLMICDLEGRWGNHLAPEISCGGIHNSGWTRESDIYDLGRVIRSMVYSNNPLTKEVEWPLPAPLEAIAGACTRHEPIERPSLKELRAMVETIECD